MRLEVDLVAEMTVINPFDFFLEKEEIEHPFSYGQPLETELPYLITLPAGPRLQEFLAAVPRQTQRTVDFLVALNALAHRTVKYVIRMEPGVQTPEQTWKSEPDRAATPPGCSFKPCVTWGWPRRVCVRLSHPIEARCETPRRARRNCGGLYRSARLGRSLLAGHRLDSMSPDLGLLAGEGHVRFAATPDPSSAAPITGSIDPCEVEFKFEMSVRRIHEDPRITEPYTDKQWTSARRLHLPRGASRRPQPRHAADQRLRGGGPPAGPLPGDGPHAGPDGAGAHAASARSSVHAGPAPIVMTGSTPVTLQAA